jgi:hypothetical protein
MDFLVAMENSVLARWIVESPSLLAYPLVLFLHAVGLALIVGLNAALDLRILGVGSDIHIAPMERFYPIMVIGFWINAISGVGLLLADATKMLTDPLFYTKLALIFLAVGNLVLLRRWVLRDPYVDEKPLPTKAKILAITSLLLWIGATTAGRLTAYLGAKSVYAARVGW